MTKAILINANEQRVEYVEIGKAVSDAEISRAEGGVWVQAWIWVPDDASE